MTEATACLLGRPGCSTTGRIKRGLCNKHYLRAFHASGGRKSPKIDQFSRYEVDSNGCWIWTGPIGTDGYGVLQWRGQRGAHRVFYRRLVGEVPEGLELDHLCRNRACVNPGHLEPVTRSENNRRGLQGYGVRHLCRNGMHDITDPANIYVRPDGTARTCHPCMKAMLRRSSAKHRDKVRGVAGGRQSS